MSQLLLWMNLISGFPRFWRTDMPTVRFTYLHTCELYMTKKREKMILAYILPQTIAEILAKARVHEEIVVANNEIDATKKSNDHADAAVRCGSHCPMKHNQGFTRSQWMPPSGECLHRIAKAAAIVDDFGRKHKTLTKNCF